MCDVWEIQEVIMTPNDSGWWCLTAVLNNSQKYSMLKEEKKYSTTLVIGHTLSGYYWWSILWNTQKVRRSPNLSSSSSN